MRHFAADVRSLPYKDRQSCLSAIGRAPQPAVTLHFNPSAAEFYLVQANETMQRGMNGQFNVFILKARHRNRAHAADIGVMNNN